MPYRYVLRWSKAVPESVSVQAYHRYPHTSTERRRPAFTIGSARGSRLLPLRDALQKAKETHPSRQYGATVRVALDHDDHTAYRLGMAAALVSRASTATDIERSVRYVLGATPEEIWFWSSKFLDERIGNRALDALATVVGVSRERARRSTALVT